MILSYHPCYVADENRICAERPPDEADLARMRAAKAVILPQGCKPALYAMARHSGAHLFPNYAARFDYPGKTGQIRLFREFQAPHPVSRLYPAGTLGVSSREMDAIRAQIGFPLVFKLDYGGEGDTVARIEDADHLRAHLRATAAPARCPFLVQRLIPAGQRSLRVVVIGQRLISYWRVNPDPQRFGTSAANGARIDHDTDPDLQATGRRLARDLCDRSGIDLAGLDLIFASDGPGPVFLEINYYFGRRGLGGSDAFYAILGEEIDRWLTDLPATNAP